MKRVCASLFVVGLYFAAPGNAKAAPTPAPSPAPVPVQYLETGSSHETLTNHYGDWDSTYIRFVRRDTGDLETVYASYESVERYGRHDTQATAGAYFPFAANWLANVEATGSGTHNVLPSSSVTAGIQYGSGGHWYEGVAVRRIEYDAGNVDEQLITLEHYWSNYRFSYVLTLATLAGTGSQAEHSAEVDRYYGTNSSYAGLSFVTGREIDNFGTPVLATSNVHGWTIAGRHWMNDNWALVYAYSRLDQGVLYARMGGRLGLDYRF
jgi:YaiO family outer membrane protein